MKDSHGRIARGFTLLAEYDFEIFYRAGKDNACDEFLSRTVELMMVVESCKLKANLNAIAHYLNIISVTDESISITL